MFVLEGIKYNKLEKSDLYIAEKVFKKLNLSQKEQFEKVLDIIDKHYDIRKIIIPRKSNFNYKLTILDNESKEVTDLLYLKKSGDRIDYLFIGPVLVELNNENIVYSSITGSEEVVNYYIMRFNSNNFDEVFTKEKTSKQSNLNEEFIFLVNKDKINVLYLGNNSLGVKKTKKSYGNEIRIFIT
ncbi:MAG: hypothetical protein ABGW69_02330 [Nanoarchaeota archaeon]